MTTDPDSDSDIESSGNGDAPTQSELQVKLALGSLGFAFLLFLFALEAWPPIEYTMADRTLYVLTELVLLLLGFDDIVRYLSVGEATTTPMILPLTLAVLQTTTPILESVIEIPPDVKAIFWVGLAAAVIAVIVGPYFSKAFPLIYKREIPPEYPLLFYTFGLVLLFMSNPAWARSLSLSLKLFVVGFSLAIALTVVAAIWL